MLYLASGYEKIVGEGLESQVTLLSTKMGAKMHEHGCSGVQACRWTNAWVPWRVLRREQVGVWGKERVDV
ncbi:hypothetical protein CDL15_Pgr023417 [Punica granatum]|uniref:Uncharacterized protein n=1 Tax=Punica granatum TaxID=22663 RepID=A0A218XQC7_PUNGR|nr:hypothetical protein CDL15_Pgr023417 [Punica granatum]